ncbi:helix-turn-helix transcriptional regulator [Nocardia sp. NPDC049737]|uniref:helix-turn-helix domain-containing protein n=1 Tax=Nocardia sp. NPDC049737 TaxID=3154358 RepID=UPI00343894D9
MSVTGSTLARRALGRELRRLRTVKGMYQAEAARLAETSPQSIGRIEEGRSTRITSFQINALCDAYGATDDERRILLGWCRRCGPRGSGAAAGGVRMPIRSLGTSTITWLWRRLRVD